MGVERGRLPDAPARGGRVTVQTDDLIKDTVDLHYHSGPSPFPRRLDPVESAKHYEAHGFKAVVYKSHHHNTVMDVLSIKASVLDNLRVRVFGGIALNGLVGEFVLL